MKRGTLLLAALLCAVPTWAGAEPDAATLEARRDAALTQAGTLEQRIADLERRYEELQDRADRMSAGLVDAYRMDLETQVELEEAREQLNDRADAAYRAGPALFLQTILDVGSVAEMFEAREIIERTFVADVERLAGILDERLGDRSTARRLERRRAVLARQQAELNEIHDALLADLRLAETAALAAGRRLRSLERVAARLEEAAERAEVATVALTGDAGLDELLARLGPDGGRGCDIPPDLERTGQTFSGVASWYGWDFAGNPTASGAIYDPRLFTAAHRTLPLNTYVHVTHAGRCATVLVNDRGPYIDGRVLDLSQAAAEYLGVGLNEVDAEILAVR